MTATNHRKSLARELQTELGISYSAALNAVDTQQPPPGWVVLRSSYDVDRERYRRAAIQAAESPQDPVAHLVAAFAALELHRHFIWAPRCNKHVEGIDPHSGNLMTVMCERPEGHEEPCASDGVLYFLWEESDIGPAGESFKAVRDHLRWAWRALGRSDGLDEQVRSLVRVVANRFDEEMEETWANMRDPASPQLPLRPSTFFNGGLMRDFEEPAAARSRQRRAGGRE